MRNCGRSKDGLARHALVLGLVSIAGPLAMTMYVPAFPAIAADLGGKPAAIQYSVVSFLLALAIGQNIFGPLSDRIGRKLPLYLGLGLFCLASAGASASSTVGHLIAWRFLQGIGACAAMSIPRAITRDLYTGSSAARLIASIMLVASVAPLLAPMAGTALVEVFGWRSIFIFIAFAGILGLLAVFFLLRETLPPAARSGGRGTLRGYGSLLSNKDFVFTILMVGAGQSIFPAYLAASPFVFMETYRLDVWEFSLFCGLSAVSFVGAAQVAHRLMDRLGTERLLFYCVGANAIATVLALGAALLGWSNVITAMTCVVVSFAALGILVPVGTVFALHNHPTVAGSASALIGTFGFAGGAISSAAVTLFANGTDVPMFAAMAAAASLSALAATVALKAKHDVPNEVEW